MTISQVIETRNVELCNTLGESYKKECRIAHFMNEAVVSEDMTKCDFINDELMAQSGSNGSQLDRAEQCRMSVVMRKSDAKLSDCDVLKIGQSKDMCIAIMKNRLQS